jgi:hypothetical protein
MVKTWFRSYKRVLTWFASRRPQTPVQASQEASLKIQRPQGAGRPCYEAANSACRGEWRREAGSIRKDAPNVSIKREALHTSDELLNSAVVLNCAFSLLDHISTNQQTFVSTFQNPV